MSWLTLVYNFTKLHIDCVCVHNWRWKLCIHADAGAIKVVEPPVQAKVTWIAMQRVVWKRILN